MIKYSPWRLTKYGEEIMSTFGSKRNVISIYYLGVGNGYSPTYNYYKSESLSNLKNKFNIEEEELIKDPNPIQQLKFSITNINKNNPIPEEYKISELGLFVLDEQYQEKMIAYSTSSSPDEGELIYPLPETPKDNYPAVNIRYTIYMAITNKSKLQVTYDYTKIYLTEKTASNIYTSKKDFNDTINPLREDLNQLSGTVEIMGNNINSKVSNYDFNLFKSATNENLASHDGRLVSLEQSTKVMAKTIEDNQEDMLDHAKYLNIKQHARLKTMTEDLYTRAYYGNYVKSGYHMEAEHLFPLLKVIDKLQKQVQASLGHGNNVRVRILSKDSYNSLMGINTYPNRNLKLVITDTEANGVTEYTQTIDDVDKLYDNNINTPAGFIGKFTNIESRKACAMSIKFFDKNNTEFPIVRYVARVSGTKPDLFSDAYRKIYSILNGTSGLTLKNDIVKTVIEFSPIKPASEINMDDFKFSMEDDIFESLPPYINKPNGKDQTEVVELVLSKNTLWQMFVLSRLPKINKKEFDEVKGALYVVDQNSIDMQKVLLSSDVFLKMIISTTNGLGSQIYDTDLVHKFNLYPIVDKDTIIKNIAKTISEYMMINVFPRGYLVMSSYVDYVKYLFENEVLTLETKVVYENATKLLDKDSKKITSEADGRSDTIGPKPEVSRTYAYLEFNNNKFIGLGGTLASKNYDASMLNNTTIEDNKSTYGYYHMITTYFNKKGLPLGQVFNSRDIDELTSAYDMDVTGPTTLIDDENNFNKLYNDDWINFASNDIDYNNLASETHLSADELKNRYNIKTDWRIDPTNELLLSQWIISHMNINILTNVRTSVARDMDADLKMLMTIING